MEFEMVATEKEIHKYNNCCGLHFFLNIITIIMLVLFAGIMFGLTLGLMSMSRVDLEVLSKSGKRRDRRCAYFASCEETTSTALHTSSCLYSCYGGTSPFTSQFAPRYSAILISVTLILLFGEIIPHAVCCRYSLIIGAALTPVVHILLWTLFPVAYPISKLLDFLLGKGCVALFRRAELKTLVALHGNDAGKGGELSGKETLIISGALELTEKTARDAMTPMPEIFSVDINAKLDRALLYSILENGHSRVPVYHEQPKNIILLILVKNLLTINPADEELIKTSLSVGFRESMPLYDILNEFQKGLTHIALVLRHGSEVNEIYDEMDHHGEYSSFSGSGTKIRQICVANLGVHRNQIGF